MGWTDFLGRWLEHDARAGAESAGVQPTGAGLPSPDSLPAGPLAPEDRVRAALRTVEDPELGMNIVDLGLVYAVDATDHAVRADITLTTPTCPLGEMVAENARAAIGRALPDVRDLQVRLVWEPRWTPSMMSDHARKQLGW